MKKEALTMIAAGVLSCVGVMIARVSQKKSALSAGSQATFLPPPDHWSSLTSRSLSAGNSDSPNGSNDSNLMFQFKSRMKEYRSMSSKKLIENIAYSRASFSIDYDIETRLILHALLEKGPEEALELVSSTRSRHLYGDILALWTERAPDEALAYVRDKLVPSGRSERYYLEEVSRALAKTDPEKAIQFARDQALQGNVDLDDSLEKIILEVAKTDLDRAVHYHQKFKDELDYSWKGIAKELEYRGAKNLSKLRQGE